MLSNGGEGDKIPEKQIKAGSFLMANSNQMMTTFFGVSQIN